MKKHATPAATGAGSRLRQARERLGLSRREFADRAGFSHTYIAKIEYGEQNPESRSWRILADALMVSYDWLVGGTEDESRVSITREVLTPNEYKLIHNFRNLPHEHKMLFITYVETTLAYLKENPPKTTTTKPPSIQNHQTLE